MEKNSIKKILIFLTIATLLTTVIIPTSVADEQQDIEQVQFLISNHELDLIQISVSIPDFTFKTTNEYDQKFSVINLIDEGISNKIGQATLPKIRRMIEIPSDTLPVIRLTSESWTSFNLIENDLPKEITPLQKQIIKEDSEDFTFDFDEEYYNDDSFYPKEKVDILEINEIRGRRFALIELSPVLYNPVPGLVKMMSSCTIELKLDGYNIQKTIDNIEHYSVPAFEELYEKIFVNYGYYENLGKSTTRDTEGYLIIVHDDFYNEILPLKDWKNIMGYETTVTNTSDIPGGVTTTNIKTYIQNAYNTWPVPPAYILLVGDTPQIPTFTGSASGTATDTYYGTMDGDIFSDIYIGRFPASTESEVTIMVDKTIYYEQGDFPSIDWIKNATFMASVDNYQISEGTHNYVIDRHLIPRNYSVDKLYQVTYGATTQDVRDSINAGCSIAIYSGHGSTTSWADGPPFSQSDVNNLQNLGMYPFVCSHACVTGKFDISECFGETWLRAEDKGAIAFWGSSHNTYWTEDDTIEKKTFDAWWNDSMVRIGQMTDKGLYDAYQYHGGGNMPIFVESYNVLGDASIKVWTEDPFVPEHDISADNINIDAVVAHGETQTVTATIRNTGNNTETNININFTINDTVIDTDTIIQLDPKQSIVVSFDWNPDYGTYLVRIESTPVPGENITDNNQVNTTVTVIAAPDVYVDPVSFEFHVNAGDSDDDLLLVGNEVWAEASLNFNASVSGGSWLSVSPLNGVVPVDDVLSLTVSVDASGLTEGLYSGFVIVECDDLDEPVVSVPVDMFVVFADDVGAIGVNYPVGQQLPGSYTVNASVENFGSSGNTFMVNCSIFEGANLLEDFEDDDGGYSGTNDWEWGVPTSGPSSAYSGSNCWATNLDGDYANNVNEWVDSAPVNIPAGVPAELGFWHWFDIEDGYSHYDGGNVKISTDGGSSWSILGSYLDPYPIQQCYSSNSGIPGEPCFSGSSGGWEFVTFDLSSYAGEQVLFRWHFGTDGSSTRDGWFIDDVSVNVQGSLEMLDDTPVYTSSTSVYIDAYDSVYIEFTPAWDANQLGVYAINVITLLPGDEDSSNDGTMGIVEIASAPEGHVSMLSSGWNFVSGPFNESVLKENLVVVYDTVSYSWSDAVSGGLVSDVLFGWSGVSQSYVFGSGLVPGDGFWVYAFVNCELKAPVFSVNFDGYISPVVAGWNVVGLPYNAPMLKDSLVLDDGVEYGWSDAVSAGMISDVLFGWDSVGQSYVFSDGLYPGCAVWLYAFDDCVLESPLD